jgi:hypothetical protein
VAERRFSFGFSLHLAAAVLAGTLLPAAARGAEETLALRDVDGREVRPLQGTGTTAAVFLFVRTDCPISNRYAPEVLRLHELFAVRGVAFWLVYPDPAESPDAIRAHVKAFAYPMPALRDPDHALTDAAGVRVTPEAAVYATAEDGARLVYHGRIDDRQVDFGRARPAPTRRDLEDVLTALIEGRPAPLASAPAVGCFIADTR